MNTRFPMLINGRTFHADSGASVLSALQQAGVQWTRRDLAGAPRFALCGMGVCQECAVTIDQVPGQLACLRRCRPHMQVDTDV